MYAASSRLLILSVVFGASAVAQIPPRYEIVQLTENPYYEHRPAINNRGQIVFARRLGANEFSDEIFLYEDGEFIQLTHDNVRDAHPEINDDGTIVWCRGIGPDGPYGPTLEIVIYQDGDLSRLTDNALKDTGPSINNLGHVAWSQWVRGGCHDSNAVICFYDGSTIEQITDGDWSHQSAVINDDDWIAWTRYDFCQEPWWDSEIMLRVPGAEPEVITPPETYAPVAPTLNNAGQVAWQYDHGRGDKGIELWEGGVTAPFTDWGGGPELNDHGDICFHRWYEDEETYQMWLYLRGHFYQLSDDPFWNDSGDINNVGEVVWPSGDYPWADIRLLRRVPPARTDASGKVDARDVRPVPP